MSGEADPATAAATAQAASFKAASDKLRERSETAAKALAGLGTTGLTAVGVTKFSDIFPSPPDATLQSLIVVAGFIFMTCALAGFTLLLWNANRPLVTGVDPSQMGENDKEEEEIEGLYQRVAKLNGVRTLEAYQARAFRFQQIAERTEDDNEALKLTRNADRIGAEILATQARAALVVIRRRINEALKGRGALGLALLFLAGLLMFGLGSDYLDSERTSAVATLKACSDAIEAKVDRAQLPGICENVRSSAAPAQPTADQARAARVQALSESYSGCIDTAVAQKEPIAMCDGIKARLVAAAQ